MLERKSRKHIYETKVEVQKEFTYVDQVEDLEDLRVINIL